MHGYSEGVEANKLRVSLFPRPGVVVHVKVSVRAWERAIPEKHKRQRERRSSDTACAFACSVVMHWFYEFPVKSNKG